MHSVLAEDATGKKTAVFLSSWALDSYGKEKHGKKKTVSQFYKVKCRELDLTLHLFLTLRQTTQGTIKQRPNQDFHLFFVLYYSTYHCSVKIALLLDL